MEKETNNDLRQEDSALVDILSVVEDCASSLSVADPFLCNKDTFNLHDSMAALELMDRKLDCCEIPISAYRESEEGDTTKHVPPRPPPTGLEELPWDSLTLKDARIIALELLTRLESLLSGASVSESTFTCLYTHAAVMTDMQSLVQGPSLTERMGALLSQTVAASDASSAQHAVYAACLGSVAISQVVQNIVFNADIYEEEDFSINTYGLLDFFGDKEDEAMAVDVLDSAASLISQTANGEDGMVITLVLGFFRDFLRACIALASLSASEVRDVAEVAKQLVRVGAEKLDRLKPLIADERAGETNNLLLMQCFDLYVNRPLVGNTPIRKVVFRSPEQCLVTFKTILSEMDWALCDLILWGSSLGRIRRMLERVSSASVNVLNRSLIVLNLYFSDRLLGQYTMDSLLTQHLVQLSGIPRVVVETDCFRAFLNRLAKPIYDTLKLLLLNRNRQRAYMEAVMFQDWSVLQQEAHAVDAKYRKELGMEVSTPPFLTFYVLAITCSLMEQYIGLGIELELFRGHHELSVAYWYRDYLLSSLLNSMTAMGQSKLASRPQTIETPKKGKKKGGARKKANGNQKRAEIELSDREDEFEFLLIELKRDICRGLVRFIAALTQAELFLPQAFEFTSFEKRFQNRFEPFDIVLQPPKLKYDDFQKGFDFSGVQQLDLLASAADCFKRSKGIVDELLRQEATLNGDMLSVGEPGLRSLAKVCVGNSVFILKLTQQIQSAGKAKGNVLFDLQTNNQFCTIKIT